MFKARLARLRRKSLDLRASGASRRQVLAYNLKYVVAKFPLLLQAIKARSERRETVARVRAGQLGSGDVPTVLVLTSGSGMGDDINFARFMRDLHAAAGPLLFDVASASEGRARMIFAGVPGFRGTRSSFVGAEIAGLYDLALDLSHVAAIRHDGLAVGRARVSARLREIAARLAASTADNQALIERMPYTSGYFGRQAVYRNATYGTFLQAQAGIAYGGDRLPLESDAEALKKFGLRPGHYITFHNGFDPAFVITQPIATRCYPHFERALAAARRARPGLRFVQLGAATSTPIPGIDLDLIGKTTLGELAALSAGAALHLDNESGLVHLAAALGTRSCVVFGPTDCDYFGYPQNINLPPPFCGGCWWVNDSWMDRCPRGFPEARCMSLQPPEAVAQALVDALEPVAG